MRRLSLFASDKSPLQKRSVIKQESLLDYIDLHGKIKVLAEMNNPETCISVSLSPNGKFYAVALANGLINVFYLKNDNLVFTLNKEDTVSGNSATAVKFRPNISTSQFNALSFETSTSIPTPSGSTGRKFSIDSAVGSVLHRDEEVISRNVIVCTFTSGAVKTFNVVTGDCLNIINENRETLTMDYSKFGDSFATAGGDGVLNVYDEETRKKIITYEPPFYENRLFRRTYCVAYHPQSKNEIISGGWDGKLQFYDLRVPSTINQTYYGMKIIGEGIDFHPSGKEFCTACWSKKDTLQLWDYSMKKPIVSLDNYKLMNAPNVNNLLLPSSMLYSCRYYLNGNFITIGGNEENSLVVFDRYTNNEIIAAITGLKKSVYCVDTCGSKIAFVSGKSVAVTDVFV